MNSYRGFTQVFLSYEDGSVTIGTIKDMFIFESGDNADVGLMIYTEQVLHTNRRLVFFNLMYVQVTSLPDNGLPAANNGPKVALLVSVI